MSDIVGHTSNESSFLECSFSVNSSLRFARDFSSCLLSATSCKYRERAWEAKDMLSQMRHAMDSIKRYSCLRTSICRVSAPVLHAHSRFPRP